MTNEAQPTDPSGMRRTPLYSFHARHGARFVNFGGWEMPVQYRSILDEHRAVRTAAGLFDVSHMGEFEVEGPQAETFLDHLLTNRIAGQPAGKAVYSPMCYPDGGTVDDLLVYKWSDHRFLVCVNASNIVKDFAWFTDRKNAGGFDCVVRDVSDDYALLALQGPAAAAILQPLVQSSLDTLGYYTFAAAKIGETEVILARTGYTGEDGFEIFLPPHAAEAAAEAILAAGASHGLELAGLGARDSLRLEAGYPLYGHELTAEISPLQAGLGWTVKMDKGDFVGRAALAAQKSNGIDPRVVYFRTGNRRIVRAESPVFGPEGQVGTVLSGTLSPHLNEAVGTALVSRKAASGPLHADLRGSTVALTVVKPPFYRRAPTAPIS